MVEDGEEKKEEKKRISSFNGYLSHSSSRVEFELGLGLRLTKNSHVGLNFSEEGLSGCVQTHF